MKEDDSRVIVLLDDLLHDLRYQINAADSGDVIRLISTLENFFADILATLNERT